MKKLPNKLPKSVSLTGTLWCPLTQPNWNCTDEFTKILCFCDRQLKCRNNVPNDYLCYMHLYLKYANKSCRPLKCTWNIANKMAFSLVFHWRGKEQERNHYFKWDRIFPEETFVLFLVGNKLANLISPCNKEKWN